MSIAPRHGQEIFRVAAEVPHSSLPTGKFGRLFRTLAPFGPSDDLLAELGRAGGPMEDDARRAGDNTAIPVGFTYLGQFIDHDITFDPVSQITRKNDPDSLHNFRTPRFDLDSMYGFGPVASPHLYNRRDPDKLLTARNGAREPDLPRNSQEIALVGDPRNDENILISQMQVAFLHFHNAVVEFLRARRENLSKHRLPGESLFDTARRLVRWHYQWIVVHDFLPRVAGRDVVNELLTQDAEGRPQIGNVLYQPVRNAFIPVEFSVAAYRFGHSMIRADYQLNNAIFANIFGRPADDPLTHLGGSRVLPDLWQIKWPLFFKFPGRRDPQPSRTINAALSKPLLNLPVTVIGEEERERHPERRSLAARNLLRGKALRLPSGQAVAAEMGEPVLTNSQLGLDDAAWGDEAPLWFYILKESARAPMGGKRLGRVGGRIVADVLLGLLEHDKESYVNHSAVWRPVRPLAPKAGDFKMNDLIKFADIVEGDISGPD
jgi:Animal haem peroxidase